MSKIKRSVRVITDFSDVRIDAISEPHSDADTKGNVISFSAGNSYPCFSIRREDIPYFIAIVGSFQ